MEQRVSGLQARLEARRNMFLKTDNNGSNNATYGTNGNKPANSTTGRTKINQNLNGRIKSGCKSFKKGLKKC